MMTGDQLLLALDFGGTKLAAAVMLVGEQAWRTHRHVFSPPDRDFRYDVETMFSLARELLDGTRPAAIGVSFGGPVDASTGIVRRSYHVAGWENTSLRAMLEAEFGAPSRVDNDANVAALGEHRFGSGQGLDSLLYITISTGVGGGWILNGRPWRGAEGMAGEIGHIVVDPAGPMCLCGKRGCVERLASGPYIAQRAREWLEAQPDRGHVLRRMVAACAPGLAEDIETTSPAQADLGLVTAQLVSQAALSGDELAWEALEVAAWALGVGIGNAANLINPQCFVLGGGVTKAGERFWAVIQRVSREIAMPDVHFEVLPAALGDDAPLWGAVALAQDCLFGVQS
jgi:glucokinase